MIKKTGAGFRLYTKDGSRALGPKTSKKSALAQEIAIKIAEKKRGKRG